MFLSYLEVSSLAPCGFYSKTGSLPGFYGGCKLIPLKYSCFRILM